MILVLTLPNSMTKEQVISLAFYDIPFLDFNRQKWGTRDELPSCNSSMKIALLNSCFYTRLLKVIRLRIIHYVWTSVVCDIAKISEFYLYGLKCNNDIEENTKNMNCHFIT